MLVEAEASYSAGGYPTPTYNGEIGLSFNIENEASILEVMEKGEKLAREKVAQKMCMAPQMVNNVVVRILQMKRTPW